MEKLSNNFKESSVNYLKTLVYEENNDILAIFGNYFNKRDNKKNINVIIFALKKKIYQ